MALVPILIENLPPPNVDTTLYTTSVNETITGTIFCTNQSETNDKISVALIQSGNTLTDSSYICYETTAYYGQSIYLQQIYIGSLDLISVKSQNGTSNFVLTGYQFP